MYNLTHLLSNGTFQNDRISDIAKSIYYITGISVNILDANHKKFYGYGINHELLSSYEGLHNEFIDFYEQTVKQNTYFYLFSTSYNFTYIVSILKDSNGYYGELLIGPIFLNSPTEHELNILMKKKSFSFSQRNVLKSVYNQIPLVSMSRIHYIEKSVIALINTKDYSELETNVSLKDSGIKKVEIVNPDLNMEPDAINHNYSLERLFMDKVSNGDIDQVIELYHEQVKTMYMTYTGPNKLRSTKNEAIVFCTLLSRAAIEGGVDSDHSLSLSNSFIRRIEKTLNLEELLDVIEQMSVKFTNSVLHASSINHVSVIKKASRYVHNHLSEPIRLQDVADYVGLSPNYFSSLFKKEMDLAFADYVNHTRIKESQYLLQTTNHTILDIAISVGFNNQNYFTTIFKKTTGITPKQYRMRANKPK